MKDLNLYKIGFESHIMLDLEEKLFCTCKPNIGTCAICKSEAGFFCGRVNQEAIKKGLLLAKMLNSKTTEYLEFYRKIYLYHDSLNGYQRSQHPRKPFSKFGTLSLLNEDFDVKISHILLEEDPANTNKLSIDTKRAGNALLEVVTDPIESDHHSLKRITLDYLRTLHRLCIDLKLCSKERAIKTDFNISKGNIRLELKNITSFEEIAKALDQFVILVDSNILKEGYNTVSYKKNLKSSLNKMRKKEQYDYLKEYNLKEIDLTKITPSEVDSKKILYNNKKIIAEYFSSYDIKNKTLEYSFLKLYTDLMNEKKDAHIVLKDIFNQHPKDSYRRLRSIDVVEDPRLNTALRELYKIKTFTKEDHLNKTRIYLDFLKELKDHLRSKEIKFESTLIEKNVKELFN